MDVVVRVRLHEVLDFKGGFEVDVLHLVERLALNKLEGGEVGNKGDGLAFLGDLNGIGIGFRQDEFHMALAHLMGKIAKKNKNIWRLSDKVSQFRLAIFYGVFGLGGHGYSS